MKQPRNQQQPSKHEIIHNTTKEEQCKVLIRTKTSHSNSDTTGVTEVTKDNTPAEVDHINSGPDTQTGAYQGGTQDNTAQQLFHEHSWETQLESEPVLDEPGQMVTTKHFPTASITEQVRMQTDNKDLMAWFMVRKHGYPNRYGARLPITTHWNLDEFERLLDGYKDIDIIEWMRYGWPTGRLPTMPEPTKTFKNHKGATDHPRALKKYIQKELAKGAVIGPYKCIPFNSHVGISPISTREKKQSEDRRVILDLSFPPGQSVNDGMIKNNYLGETVHLTFPGVDDLALRIYRLGKEAMMFKIDLSRYFRQLPLDPGDYSMIGYIIDDELYFDKVLPMGMRTAPYIAQRITNAIRYIHQQLEYFLLNYVDDFLGAEDRETVWRAYHHLTQLLNRINVETSPEKLVPPTTRIEFLGVTFDSQTMTMEIPRDKIERTKQELQSWVFKTTSTRKETESLIGKLQFMGKCVKPGRIFVARLLNWLRTMNRQGKYTIPLEARKDIAWWSKFLDTYNGISILWMHNNPSPDSVIATDASKKGFGGCAGSQYFRGRFPEEWQTKNIAELEIWAVIVAIRIWAESMLRGQYFWILVDNEAVSTVLNTGAARNPQLQQALREITMMAAHHQFIIKAKHISGISNRIPDWLSRWHEVDSRKKFNAYAKNKSLKRCKLPIDYLQLQYNW